MNAIIKLAFHYIIISEVILAALTRDNTSCSEGEWLCRSDAACISVDRLCDGVADCKDTSDETVLCTAGGITDDLKNNTRSRSSAGVGGWSLHHRVRRQATRCRRSEFMCRDGQCISVDGVCDGKVDCSDGSDETNARCRKTFCPENLFRCSYGACVDGDAKCNKVQDCADNSDELHPDCGPRSIRKGAGTCRKSEFQCSDGSCISRYEVCDGVANCRDSSDESVQVCQQTECEDINFRCAYGACVGEGSKCDGKQDCADGSDEADDLCNRSGTGTTNTRPQTTKPSITSTVAPGDAGGRCLLPAYPRHGKYTVEGNPHAKPGQYVRVAFMKITCDKGYGVTGDDTLYCFDDEQASKAAWVGTMPSCQRLCRLHKSQSVEYRCRIANSEIGIRECNEYEKPGTVVIPSCKAPNYYSLHALSKMTCIEGSWDNEPTCTPECGRITPAGEELVINGWQAKKGEFPWHVGIYQKTTTPYMQICGGSIVSSTLVISAAHCFWRDSDKLQKASKYAVAAGKFYRQWDAEQDKQNQQQSDVSDIRIPSLFRGSETNFQADIALVFISTPFVYKVYIRPVCLDFDLSFARQQTAPGNLGKVAGWGLTKEQGSASQILLTVSLPVVTQDDCLTNSPPGFREYITTDKICAGYLNGEHTIRKPA